MCGIFGYIGQKKDAAQLTLAGLKRLEYRGYDSWGVAQVASQSKKIELKKRVGKIGNANVDELADSSVAIGHTRWATHGGVTQLNSHPHLDCSGKIAVVHNGIVENYESLKRELEQKGHYFISETDTEVISHLLEENMKTHGFEKAFRHTFQQLEGLNAFATIHNEENKILVASNGSPLVLGFGEHENYLASDPAAVLSLTKKVHFLEDGQMAVITAESIEVSQVSTGQKIAVAPQVLEWEVSQADQGNYPHFMIKEIFEQPEVIDRIAANSEDIYEKMIKILRSADRFYLTGCGTAGYAALAGTYLFAKIAGLHSQAISASEFSYVAELMTSDDAVIALSQSGETMDVLEVLKKVKQKHSSVLALVNVLGSSLYRLADEKILLAAGPEKAVASTKAFIAKIAHLILLAYGLAGQYDVGKKLLQHAAEAVKNLLDEKQLEAIKKLALSLKNAEHIYVIGRGVSYPAALETALKIREISYIHAEGLAAGELKHGTLALIETGSICIVLAPNDETYEAVLVGAREIKARGGKIIGISHQPHEVFDEFLAIEDVGEASILPMIVNTQLLAYYLSLEKGLDPDKPRNLAKSVTVK